MSTIVKSDKEMERFIALGTKIAKRLKRKGVEMKLHITFGPQILEPTKRKARS
jgi:hypothetical protein